MRSDRLKQVMQQMDPSFDERNAGYNRFSKFVTEAGTRGLIRVIKQENGQFDVAPLAAGAAGAAVAAPAARAATAPRGRSAAPVKPAEPLTEKDPNERPGRRRRGGRGRGRGKPGEEGAAPPATHRADIAAVGGLTLAEAFHLLSRALGELPAPAAHETVRARMAVLHGKEDPLLEPGRFAMLLRQANDAEVADVRMLGDDKFEVSPHKTDLTFKSRSPVEPVVASSSDAGGSATPPVARPVAALRFRGGARSGTRPPELQMVGVVDLGGGSTPVAAVVEAPRAAADATARDGEPPHAADAAPKAAAGRKPRAAEYAQGCEGRLASKAATAPKEKKPSARPSKSSEAARRLSPRAITVARDLLGMTLASDIGGARVSGIIVETEAYLGVRDAASHAWRGVRHKSHLGVWAPEGTWYVYRSYGIHWCLNLTAPTGTTTVERC